AAGSVPKTTSEFIVLPNAGAPTDPKELQRLVNETTAAGKINVLADGLRSAIKENNLFKIILERAARDPAFFAEAAAALKLAAYQQALQEFEVLVADKAVKESKFQDLLTNNPWMFGSEYSQVMDRRRCTRDENQDFVVRRTTDNYIELIEIKTPLGGMDLF